MAEGKLGVSHSKSFRMTFGEGALWLCTFVQVPLGSVHYNRLYKASVDVSHAFDLATYPGS